MQTQKFAPWTAAVISAFAACCASTVASIADTAASNAAETLLHARMVFFFALAQALIFGVPLYRLLRTRLKITAWRSAVAGVLVGLLPAIVLSSRLAGWLPYFETLLYAGVYGGVGGFAFFQTLSFTGAIETPEVKGEKTGGRALTAYAAAAVALCAALLLPEALQDRSCHNVARDGAVRISPKIVAQLKIDASEWTTLTELFRKVETSHALSFRHDSHVQDGTLWWRTLQICNEDLMIDADHRPLAQPEIAITVSQTRDGSDWNGPARELFRYIEATWPKRMVSGPAKSE
jgi:hypothetical protein